ncbi:15125_t:CDS:1 [Cetraspora pellucida]|uniref:15125_t:CDS:1 n=1 Tax=Cetraspora pellucida TaxID=1433469 RepID=A0A9N9EW64_9GLOM|nr:15125_t:CDS:1 [Cetraspora pellucida]
MLKNFTSWAILCLLISMAAALAVPENLSLVARTETSSCPQKRSPLAKRHEEKCPCAVATAIFNNKFKGITVYTQDECGTTTATGYFSSGFSPDKQYCAFITDDCGKILHNITDALNLQINQDGSVTPFTSKLYDINLNCDEDGILLAYTPKPAENTTVSKRTEDDYYYKDPCASKYRKRAQGSQMAFYENGGPSGTANINLI